MGVGEAEEVVKEAYPYSHYRLAEDDSCGLIVDHPPLRGGEGGQDRWERVLGMCQDKHSGTAWIDAAERVQKEARQ